MQKKVRIFRFGKLVRDNIVKGIIAVGNKPDFRTLMTDEYIEELKKKVLEEAAELPKARNKDEIIEEIADIEEAVETLLSMISVPRSKIKQLQREKNNKRGSFRKRYYIESVEVEPDSEWLKYYLDNPDKYPEIK